MTPVVRPAVVEDAAGIARVQVETWRAAYAGLVPPSFLARLSVPAGTERWAGQVGSGLAVYVAGSPIAGFASGGPYRDDAGEPAGDPAGEVYALYVTPAAWGSGAGPTLLDAVTAALARRGYDHSVLWVLTGNARARAFYERHGWAPDGGSRSIDLDGPVDEIRYARRLVTPPS